jgi:hypothetical protein
MEPPLRIDAPRQCSDWLGVQQLEGGRSSWITFREVTPPRLLRDREGAGGVAGPGAAAAQRAVTLRCLACTLP